MSTPIYDRMRREASVKLSRQASWMKDSRLADAMHRRAQKIADGVAEPWDNGVGIWRRRL